MIEEAGFDVIVSLVDLVVIVSALFILGFGIYNGLLRNRASLPTGGLLLAAGLIIAVIAHLIDLSLGFIDPLHSHVGSQSDIGSTAWFSWLLSRAAFFMIAAGFVLAMFARREIEGYLKDLEASRLKTHNRFLYLFNSTSNSMYVYEFETPMPVDWPIEKQIEHSYEAVLSRCNRVFVDELGGQDAEDVIGQRWGELDSSKDGDAHAKMMREFIANDYSVSNYALEFTTASGQERAVNVNMVGILNDGALERIWAVESNVIEHRQARLALRRQKSFQQLTSRISSRLVKASSYDGSDRAVVDCMVEMTAFVHADRSLLFWLDENDPELVSLEYEFSRSGEPFNGKMALQLFPRCFERLRQHKIVRIDNVDEMQDGLETDRRNLSELGVRSLIVLPLVVGGELLGGMTFSRVVEQRPWHESDASDLKVPCELLANYILRLKSRRALNDAMLSLQRATDRLEAENVYLREEVELKHGFDDIVGISPQLMKSLQLVEQVADTKTPVLILGETGTGKELIARAIHDLSDRRDRPLVKVNCAALPASLIESELFGHEKGAFTSADSRKRGRFDLADGSTLFLDEIGEIPIELQAKLLRVLQEGEFERLGGTKTRKVDTRIIAATNRDLAVEVRNGEFRSDLFYRINTFPIEVPALRDRGDDIELLARHFVRLHGQRLGREVTEISAEMMRQLRLYDWPGNVRELDGIIQRALISSDNEVLELAEPLLKTRLDDGAPRILSSSIPELKLVERDHIVSVLEEVDWKVSGPQGAASLLGIPPSTLRSKMKKLGIARPH